MELILSEELSMLLEVGSFITLARWVSPLSLILSHGENSPQLGALPGRASRVTRLGGVLHLAFEHNQEKKRDCMKRLITSPR